MLNQVFSKYLNFSDIGIIADKKGHMDHIHFGKFDMNLVQNKDLLIA